MGDWRRSTRECTFDGLLPELRQAITLYIDQYNLGEILAESRMCVQTTSEQVKKGLFGGGNIVVVGAIVTPRWLVWAIRADRDEPSVMSARLADVVVQDYARTKFAQMVPDTGIEVSGSFTNVPERGSAFIGLGDETEAEQFRQTVLDAVQAAKK